jgi:hypothetical protein
MNQPNERPWNECPECDVLVDLPGGEVDQPGERFACRNCGTKLVAEYMSSDAPDDGEWILLTAAQYDADESTALPNMGRPMDNAEFDPAQLDPGVRRLVVWLRDNGFRTTDSGDGKTKIAAGYSEDEDGVCPGAHVAIGVRPEDLVSEADRLVDLLRDEHGVEIEPTPSEGNPPMIDASYCATSRSAMIMLLHVTDDMLRPAE